MSSLPLALDLRDLAYAHGSRQVLNLPQLSLQAGASCAVLGPSGCGKTTLLHLIAGLLRPQVGEIRVLGQDMTAIDGAACDHFRGSKIGIVFQRLHLLPALNVLDNLLLAQTLAGVAAERDVAMDLLTTLGIEDLARRRPQALSQGQAQRVAIARALVHRPSLLLADEPTSSLDDDTAQRAVDLLCERAAAIGAALLLVTHDRRIRGRLDSELLLEAPR